MEEGTEAAQVTYNQDYQVCDELEVGGGSFSTLFAARTEESAVDGGPCAVGDGKLKQSPAFTCRSSFNCFLVDDDIPCSASGGFSFSSCHESSAIEFSCPISSMPSFTFFSPMSTLVQGNISLRFKANESSLDVTYTGTCFLYAGSNIKSRVVMKMICHCFWPLVSFVKLYELI